MVRCGEDEKDMDREGTMLIGKSSSVVISIDRRFDAFLLLFSFSYAALLLCCCGLISRPSNRRAIIPSTDHFPPPMTTRAALIAMTSR